MSLGSFGFGCVPSGTRRRRRFNLDACGLTQERVVVARFIKARLGSLSASRCRRVHSGSSRFTWTHIGIAVFFPVR